MTRHVTPTGLAKEGGRAVKLLASTEAVLAAMPDDGLLIVANARAGDRARAIWTCAGRPGVLDIYCATRGPDELWTFRRERVIGVDVNAWHGIPIAMWSAIQSVLETRYSTVHWG